MAKKLTSAKAKKILHDKSVHGHPLTEQQRKFFGAIAGGAKPYKAEEGGWLDKYEAQKGVTLTASSLVPTGYRGPVATMDLSAGTINPTASAADREEVFARIEEDYNKKLDTQRAQKTTTPKTTTPKTTQPSRGDLQSYFAKIREMREAPKMAAAVATAKKKAEEAASLEYIRRNQSYLSAVDMSPGAVAARKKATEDYLRQQAQQRSALAQTFGSFTPSGSPAAGVIGAETFVNLNPITGPAMSAGRLTQFGLSENPYGFSSNNPWYMNALGGLGLAGDIAGLGMLGNMRLPQNAPASSQVLSRLNQQIRPLASIKPQTILQQAKPTASIIGNLSTAIRNKYIDIAEGNNLFNRAWRSPAVGLSQEASDDMFKMLSNNAKLTDAERALIVEYQAASRPFTGRSGVYNAEKREALNNIIRKYDLNVAGNPIVTRRFNPDNNSLGAILENGRLNFGDRPTSFSAGVGTPHYTSGAIDRLVIPSRYFKDVSNKFIVNEYTDLSDDALNMINREVVDQQFISHNFGPNKSKFNVSQERELIGTGLDLKRIGKVKNDIGGYDWIVKPQTAPAVDFSKYPSQLEAIRARAQRMLEQESKWRGQDNTRLRNQFETATERHNPASDYPGEKIGANTGEATEISRHANLSDANKARMAAHEVGHYYHNAVEEANAWNKYFDWSVLDNLDIKKIHRLRQYLTGSKPRFMSHYPEQTPPSGKLNQWKPKGVPSGDELRERAAQLKDYIAYKNNIPLNKDFKITKSQLNDAIKNYVKETGLDNNMTAFLAALKKKGNISGFLKEMNKRPLSVAPFIGIGGAGLLGEGTLQEKKQNGGWLDKYEEGGVLKQKTTDNYGTKPNANNSDVSLPPGFVGLAYNTKGRNYSPAWGGQFQDGGYVAQKGKEITYTHQPSRIRDGFIDLGPGEAYMLKRTVTPYTSKRDVRRFTETPTDPRQVNFISNYAGAIGEPLSEDYGEYPTKVPYEGEKHWNIDRFVIDPGFIFASNTMPRVTDFGQAKKNVLADMYKYNMLQGQDRNEAFRNAKKFVRKEVNPRINNRYFDEEMSGRLGRVHNQPITNFANQNPFIGLRTVNRERAINTSPWYTEYYKNPLTERDMRKISLDYLKDYRKMSGKESRKMIKDWIVAADEYDRQYERDKANPQPTKSVEGCPPGYEYNVEAQDCLPIQKQLQMGGNLPGATGMMYARTINPAPSNGPYAKKTKASAQDGKKLSYSAWKKKHNLKETEDYNLKRAWELGYAPDKTGHLPTVDNQTGEFLKAKGHPTLQLEIDWYNSPEAADFRSKNIIDSSGKFYKYVPKGQNGQEMKFYQEGLDFTPKTISQKGETIKPTTTDSLLLYKNQLLKDAYYKNNPDYRKEPNPATTPARPWPPVLSELVKELEDYEGLKNDSKYIARSVDYLREQFGKSISHDELKKRFKKVSGNVYSTGDIASSSIDDYFNPSAPPSYFSNVIKPHSWAKYFSEKYRDTSEVPMYDPIAIKPYNMLTVEEKKTRDRKYPKPKPEPKPEPEIELPSLRQRFAPIEPEGDVNLEYTLPTPRQPILPKPKKLYIQEEEKATPLKDFIERMQQRAEERKGERKTKKGIKSQLKCFAGVCRDEDGNIVSAQDGSEIPVDSMGYWNPENWGNPVTIPSTDITMEGVDQPLIGISDTGDVQYMEPGEDYQFDGEYVTEYPVAQNGKRTRSSANIEAIKKLSAATRDDSLRVYNNAMQLKAFYDKLRPYYGKVEIIPFKDAGYRLGQVESGEIQEQTLKHYNVTEKNKDIIRANKNPNVFYLSDLITGAIDPAAPLAIYDKRIKPQGLISYDPFNSITWMYEKAGNTKNSTPTFTKDVSLISAYLNNYKYKDGTVSRQEALQAMSKYGFDEKTLRNVIEKEKDATRNLPGYATTIPYYDPIAVKPYDMLTVEEKKIRQTKYPPISPKPPAPPKPKPVTPKPPTPKPPPEIEIPGLRRTFPPMEVERDINLDYTLPTPKQPTLPTLKKVSVPEKPEREKNTPIKDFIQRAQQKAEERKGERKTRKGIKSQLKCFAGVCRDEDGNIVARDGVSVNNADAQPIEKLDQLLNFTNYNKPTKGGWLDKYN